MRKAKAAPMVNDGVTATEPARNGEVFTLLRATPAPNRSERFPPPGGSSSSAAAAESAKRSMARANFIPSCASGGQWRK